MKVLEEWLKKTEVHQKIGPYYVYVLIDPRNNQPFYVGKGQGSRLVQHAIEFDHVGSIDERGRKNQRIHEIKGAGREVEFEILRWGIETKDEAYRIEATVIDAFSGVVSLTNEVRGHGIAKGRTPLQPLISEFQAPPLTTTMPALLITLGSWWHPEDELMMDGVKRTGYGWRLNLSDNDKYLSVRGHWHVDESRVVREQIHHAVAVVEGVTRWVCRVDSWTQASPQDGRRCFNGALVKSGEVWEEFVGLLGKRVNLHARNPIRYWPLEERA